MAQLFIRLFGYPQCLIDDVPIKVERRKTLALVAYLAVSCGAGSPGCGREQLAALLWPDCSQEQSSAYLRQALWDFGKSVDFAKPVDPGRPAGGWLTKNTQYLCLEPQANLRVDVNEFTASLAEWRQSGTDPAASRSILEEAVAYYQNDFLAGFTLRDSPAFDDWQTLQAESLRIELGHALEVLVGYCAGQADFQAALAHARRWLELDPLNEAAHRALMRLYARSGQHNAALRQYETCQRLLQDQLGVPPDTQTAALFERLQAGVLAPGFPETAPAQLPSQPAPAVATAQARPAGTVTFLFTDIEGSTRLWENQPEAMPAAFARQEAIVRSAMAEHGGYVYKMIGDAFQVAFATAPAALAAALAAQRALLAEPWGAIGSLKVRMALCIGVTEERDDDYVGPVLNRMARMMNAGHGGQVLLNQPTYELVRDHLPEEVTLLDLGEHRLKDLIHPEHLYQLVAPDLPQVFPALKSQGSRPVHLPPQTTTFVGREAELARIAALLEEPECRLISLVGIGGIGKTRLSIQAAAQSQAFPDGIYFVSLASVAAREGLITTIAEAINLVIHIPRIGSLSADTIQAQLFRYLGEKQVLLVLDNFEQLTACADFLQELLAAAQGLKLLVTSRESLNLPGEWVLEVAGLAYPGSRAKENIPQYAAVQLFEKGAQRSAQFSPTSGDWPAIARICQLVEGMPLAVEMAAAWVKMLSCQEIATEIERDLDFLSAQWRGMPERHRTLRAVFEYSWQLLSDADRRTFCQLSVFQDGFPREAALQVASASLPRLTFLADKSFVRRRPGGRYDIHPLLKQYAAEKLAANQELLSQTRARHARYFTDWLCQTFEQLKGGQQLPALAALRADQRNLRRALEWLVEQHEVERICQTLLPMILFYVMNDRRVVMRATNQLLLAVIKFLEADPAPGTAYPGLRALLYAAARFFSADYAHLERINPYQQASLEIISELPDCLEKAYALLLNCSGPGILSPQENLDLIQQSIDLFNRLDDAWGAAMAQMVRGDIGNFTLHDNDLARYAYRTSLVAFTRLGNDWGRALSLNGLLLLEYGVGNLDEAYILGRQCLEIYQQMDNFERLLDVRHVLGDISAKRGEVDEARAYFTANLAYSTQAGDEWRQSMYREWLAQLTSAGDVQDQRFSG
jgi:predicted ATPase/DNA-binding SARP family transcriptional activator